MQTNIRGDFYCQYCGKHSPTKQGNAVHELRCKQNPNGYIFLTKDNKNISVLIKNSQHYLNDGWIKLSNFRKDNYISYTKGKVVINNGKNLKYVSPSNLQYYLDNGWQKGITEEKRKQSIGSYGKCLDPEQEEIRRKKISKSMKNNPKCGGYRKGSGRGKSGWYKNIYCDSSWELAFLFYHLDNNLNIKRCKDKRKYIFEGIEHTYTPDFETDEGIIEIKGYTTKQWEAKKQQNPDVKVLYEKDINFYLDYVKEKIGDNFIEILYENS